jgi:hypothetical protein
MCAPGDILDVNSRSAFTCSTKPWSRAIGEAELSHLMAGYVGGDREHPTRRTRDIPDCLDIRERQEDLRAFQLVVPQALGYERHSLAYPRAIRNVVSLDAGSASDSLLRRDS